MPLHHKHQVRLNSRVLVVMVMNKSFLVLHQLMFENHDDEEWLINVQMIMAKVNLINSNKTNIIDAKLNLSVI
jgi:hypothetical protein